MPTDKPPACSLAEARRLFHDAFPASALVISAIGYGTAELRLPAGAAELRPGGTVSGPTLMDMADAAAWVAVFGAVGPQVMAVTSHLDIDFLRRPGPDADIIARAELLRVGRRQCVADVRLHAAGGDERLLARAGVTYALP